MGLEGLDFVLGKKEVVATVAAADLLARPEQVESDYRRHVRTYVPISRAAEGRDGGMTVESFERKVIRAVKDARAPVGYLTGEYGYGKTSTALYLWQRAEEANLVAAPPFQMLHLQDLVTATHGWARYRLAVRAPHLVNELDNLYQGVSQRSVEQEARASGIDPAILRQWQREGRFLVDLQEMDYVQYFEAVAGLVKQAGYDGMLVIPDELQQYIEPRSKTTAEPFVPLFNLVQLLKTREGGHLNFGVLFVIPRKEVGVIRDSRADLLARMQDLHLDLTSTYDDDFAPRLWSLLAKEFHFEEVASQIAAPETLDSLGEIASRVDRSDGPRTVINTFRCMAVRYKNCGVDSHPYTPIELVDDLLAGAIPFSGAGRIQEVARKALLNAIVRQTPDRYEKAIRLAAAFPTAGAPIAIQRKYGVDGALDSLMQQALGVLVIAVGPLDQQGVTLLGLQVGNQQTKWLEQTISEFRRAYQEHHAATKDRVIRAFTNLLKNRLFDKWKVIEERQSGFVSNQGLILEGDFPSFRARFPQRKLQLRILWEDEERKDAENEGDVTLEFRLSLYGDLEDEERRSYVRTLQMDYEQHVAEFPINLHYVRPTGIPLQVQNQLKNVWSPYDLSPLVLMNIHQMLEDKRAAGVIPKQDDPAIASSFQPGLMDTYLKDLFNAELGASLGGVSEGKLVELAIERLLDARFGKTYQTLMVQSNWKSALDKYANAITLANNVYQKRGEVEVEGTKTEIASKFTLTNTTFDTFVSNYSKLALVTREFRGNEPGAIRLTLHDLERRIMEWLRASSKPEKVTVSGKQVEVRTLGLAEIHNRARELGYQESEVAEILKLLSVRALADPYQSYLLREVPSVAVDVNEVRSHISTFETDLATLSAGFPNQPTLAQLGEDAAHWSQAIDSLLKDGTPDPQKLFSLERAIQKGSESLQSVATERKAELAKSLGHLQQMVSPVPPRQMSALNSPIQGSVGFVDQVNALRTALLNSANAAQTAVAQANDQIERLGANLRQSDLGYGGLAKLAVEVAAAEQKIDKTRELVSKQDEYFNDFVRWQTLVALGSETFDTLSRMGKMAVGEMAQYESLSREISGKISSASNRLHVLPDHALFTQRLQTLSEEARKKRNAAEQAFLDLQQRYASSLIEAGGFSRDKLGKALTYNIGNPEESYQLLYQKIETLLKELASQISAVAQTTKSSMRNILSTPVLDALTSEERSNVESQAREVTREVESVAERVKEILPNITQTMVSDFPAPGEGAFTNVLLSLHELVENLGQLNDRRRELDSWIKTIQLSDTETIGLRELEALLGSESLEVNLDLAEWRSKSSVRDRDAFWALLRSLNEKQRVRITVSRVRS